MNDPKDMPIDVEATLAWLREYREKKGMSWTALGKAAGIPTGTISQVGTGNYSGNVDTQARRIFLFRQQVESQEVLTRKVIAAPKYVETPTSRRIQALLELAHMGRITVGAMGPGTSKSITALTYSKNFSNVWLATMRKTTKTPSAMTLQVLKAIGLVKSGWAQQRSEQVMEHVAGRSALLIIDEANHLQLDALEELRGWHDETQVGICLLGNEELMMRISGGQNRHEYARLSSRIGNYHIQDLPLTEDVEAYLDAVDIIEPDLRRPLIEKGISPAHGGLREVKQILEAAHMAAIGGNEPLSLSHIKAAMQSRATTVIRRRAA